MSSLANRNILICYSGASTFTNTTLEYLNSFSLFLGSNVYYLHVTHGSVPQVDLNIFDCVLISYCARLCFPGYVSASFLSQLRDYKGVKAVFVQDEYDYVNNEISALRTISPHIIFTCVPKEQVPLVYPQDLFPETQFVQVLTGYVPSNLPHLELTPLQERPIDIGYRGRDITYRYGALGDYKYRVGSEFLSHPNSHSLELDIRMDESSRIYGDKWFSWLGMCKTTLGSPSGSNIFDFDGSIAEAFKYADGNVNQVPKDILDSIALLDNKFDMGQISPRVFEATSMGCALIMVRGSYSGILSPGVHYLPIDLDFTNLSEIIDSVKDVQLLASIAKRAQYDLLTSGLYSYQSFAAFVRDKLDEYLTQRPVAAEIPLAPEFFDTSADPSSELPTLKPLHYDTFRYKALLKSLQNNSTRTLLAIFYQSMLRLGFLPLAYLTSIAKAVRRRSRNSIRSLFVKS